MLTQHKAQFKIEFRLESAREYTWVGFWPGLRAWVEGTEMRRTAGRLVCEVLQQHGIDCIFGMEDPIHIFHAIDRQAMRIITMHDERHGAIMAHGYAAITGRPGVCASTFGPGATNLITGLYEAQ